MTKVGFTGARMGMTDSQILSMNRLLVDIGGDELHHGDCIGADAEAATIARDHGYKINGHPPDKSIIRAFFPSDIEAVLKPYLDRNKDIVNETEILIATPDGAEKQRSGTWSTIRYARKLNRKIFIIMPDGTIL